MRRRNTERARSIVVALCLLGLNTGLAVAELDTAAAPAPPALSPVARHGQLSVKEGRLTNATGEPVVLRGVSTAGLHWFPDIVNRDAFAAFAQDWACDLIRLALYVGEGGYAIKPSLKRLVETGIELAVEQGLYVIVDWHVLTPGDPNDPIYAGADAFFRDIARRYGRLPNVIYELMNEPNGALSWENDLKPYAERLVGVIREEDPDNIILIGSGRWSQEIDVASASPLSGENLAYTVHFYAGTHGQELRNRIDLALSQGTAVFCSEWGTSDASGDKGPFLDKADAWLDFLEARGIGWVNWSMSNKNESSAAFKAQTRWRDPVSSLVQAQKGTSLTPAKFRFDGLKYWTEEQLSQSGAYIRSRLRAAAGF